MLNLSPFAKLEKNKLASDGAWLLLLEIQFSGATFRLVRNTEPITWAGCEWQPFPFEIGDITDNTKEIPRVQLKVCNTDRSGSLYLEEYDGGVGANVILRVVHSKNLSNPDSEVYLAFAVESTNTDEAWAYFNLGGNKVISVRFPLRRVLKDFCYFPYGKIECGKWIDPSWPQAHPHRKCGGTLNQCRERGNASRFSGEVAIPTGGVYASNI